MCKIVENRVTKFQNFLIFVTPLFIVKSVLSYIYYYHHNGVNIFSHLSVLDWTTYFLPLINNSNVLGFIGSSIILVAIGLELVSPKKITRSSKILFGSLILSSLTFDLYYITKLTELKEVKVIFSKKIMNENYKNERFKLVGNAGKYHFLKGNKMTYSFKERLIDQIIPITKRHTEAKNKGAVIKSAD